MCSISYLGESLKRIDALLMEDMAAAEEDLEGSRGLELSRQHESAGPPCAVTMAGDPIQRWPDSARTGGG